MKDLSLELLTKVMSGEIDLGVETRGAGATFKMWYARILMQCALREMLAEQ